MWFLGYEAKIIILTKCPTDATINDNAKNSKTSDFTFSDFSHAPIFSFSFFFIFIFLFFQFTKHSEYSYELATLTPLKCVFLYLHDAQFVFDKRNQYFLCAQQLLPIRHNIVYCTSFKSIYLLLCEFIPLEWLCLRVCECWRLCIETSSHRNEIADLWMRETERQMALKWQTWKLCEKKCKKSRRKGS